MDMELLPSDASAAADSDVEELPSDAEVLPEDALGGPAPAGPTQQSCCKSGCLGAIEESPALTRRILELHQTLDAASRDQKAAIQFHTLRDWATGGSGWRRYRAWNLTLCQNAVMHILKLSSFVMRKLNKQIESGAHQPERSLKDTQRQKHECPGQAKADSLLSWLYNNVAESLAESTRLLDEGVPLRRGSALVCSTALPQGATVAYLDKLDEDEAGVRWLPPGTTMAEMLDCSVSFLPHCKVAYSTFVLCYHQKWQKKLKIRAEGQHAKCTACERLKAYRKQVSAPADCKRVAEEYAQHLGEVFRDREVDQRLCVKAAICFGAARGICSQEDSLLSITIDGMDAAKFRCPRNISAAKEFQSLWRPEMTLIGAILEGVQETYYLAEPDISKSADLHCSIIGNQLEIARAAFEARGKPFPRHLRLHTDNAAAEGKNQTVAYLVHRGLFDSVVLTQFRVGHTHAKIDQRFSEVRGVLGQCTVLEEPPFWLPSAPECSHARGEHWGLSASWPH